MKQDNEDVSSSATAASGASHGAGLECSMNLPEAEVTEGVSIDDYSTWQAVRFAEPDETG